MPDQLNPSRVRRRTGAFVLIATVLFVAAVLEAGVIRDLFRSVATLRVMLPDAGLSGLAAGAPVEVVGTRAGIVKRIVIDPAAQHLHAIVELEDEMKPFVRRDSKVFIRKQFTIAGAAFLEITRGRGEPLDWDYAVLTAATGGTPTDSLGQIVEEAQRRIFPAIDDARRAFSAVADLADTLRAPDGTLQRASADLAAITARLRQGEGSVGRLLADDRLARELETTTTTLRTEIERARIAQLARDLDTTAVTANRLLEEVRATLPEIAKIAKNSATASGTLPATLIQVDRTLSELDLLLIQLRRSWLLGGGESPASAEALPRLSPIEARP